MTRRSAPEYKRQWRDYETPAGAKPVEDFFARLSDDDAASVLVEMQKVTDEGTRAARKLRGDIWEVRVDGDHRSFRVLFAPEGRYGQVLLALLAFPKTTQKPHPI